MTDPAGWNEERFQLALTLVEQACRLSRALQDRLDGDYFSKLDSSPVTLADLSVQALVGLALRKYFPDDHLLGEETAEVLDPGVLAVMKEVLEPYYGPTTDAQILHCFRPTPRASRRWILDPIDGTKGFLRRDQFAVALAHQNAGELEFGLLGCPRLSVDGPMKGSGCLGVAYQGRGAWQRALGEGTWQPIRVSRRQDVTRTRLLRSFEAAHTNEDDIEDLVRRLDIRAEPVRMDSQAKCLLLARGDAEAVVRCLSPERPNYKEKLWDQAAGWVLITEAGGRVTDLTGAELDFSGLVVLERNRGVLASNGVLHSSLLDGLVQRSSGHQV